MTKIKNLEMAATISNNNDITINTSFFGLCEKVTYVPTGSRVTVRATSVGNMRAEICQSDDRQFLAVNLLRFSNFRYDPVGEVKFFHGHDAEVACRLFAGQ